MANQLYDKARVLWAGAELDWISAQVNCCLVSGAYAFDAEDEWTSAIDGGADGPRDYGNEGSVGKPLETKGIESNGALTALQVRFTAVQVNKPDVVAIVLYQYISADDTTNPLLYYASTATGLPITPNGGDIIVTWSSGTNKILRL